MKSISSKNSFSGRQSLPVNQNFLFLVWQSSVQKGLWVPNFFLVERLSDPIFFLSKIHERLWEDMNHLAILIRSRRNNSSQNREGYEKRVLKF